MRWSQTQTKPASPPDMTFQSSICTVVMKEDIPENVIAGDSILVSYTLTL